MVGDESRRFNSMVEVHSGRIRQGHADGLQSKVACAVLTRGGWTARLKLSIWNDDVCNHECT